MCDALSTTPLCVFVLIQVKDVLKHISGVDRAAVVAAWNAAYRRCGTIPPVVTDTVKSCGCGKTAPPHFVRLKDFVPKLETALRKRVCKQGSGTEWIAEILRRANIDAAPTTSPIGGTWCKRENVLSGTGKVASMLPPGVVFGWVDREVGAASDVAAEAAPAADSMPVDAAGSTVRVGRATLST